MDLHAFEEALNATALANRQAGSRSLGNRLFNYAKGIKGQREFLASAQAIAKEISHRAKEVGRVKDD